MPLKRCAKGIRCFRKDAIDVDPRWLDYHLLYIKELQGIQNWRPGIVCDNEGCATRRRDVDSARSCKGNMSLQKSNVRKHRFFLFYEFGESFLKEKTRMLKRGRNLDFKNWKNKTRNLLGANKNAKL